MLCPFPCVRLSQADQPHSAGADCPDADVNPVADQTGRNEAAFPIVAPRILSRDRCGPIEPVNLRKVDAMPGPVRLTLRLVPVPHLYAYIKSGSSPWGRVGVAGLTGG